MEIMFTSCGREGNDNFCGSIIRLSGLNYIDRLSAAPIVEMYTTMTMNGDKTHFMSICRQGKKLQKVPRTRGWDR